MDRVTHDAHGDLTIAPDLHALTSKILRAVELNKVRVDEERSYARVAATANRIFRNTLYRSKGSDMERENAIVCSAKH